MVFSFTLIFGTLLASSSSSWVTSWIGLEMNLMSFIPLLLNKLTSLSSEASIKYFLTQAFASLIIIFSGVLFFKINSLNSLIQPLDFLTLSLGMKAGMAPTHFWFPQVMELINWTQSAILLTWQKIAPVILLSFTSTHWLTILVLLSAFTGMAGGFNQNSLKKILTYSSIAHLAWMTSVISTDEKIWWIYFVTYTILNLAIVLTLNHSNTTSLSKINSLPTNSLTKALYFMNFLSLAGLPPFLGIAPKTMILVVLMSASLTKILTATTLILTSLMTLFYYLRVFYSSMILSHRPSITVTPFLKPSMTLTSLFAISMTGNLLTAPLVLLL
uniref:NADH-ubiquinone oxidoreductase chain 2 n=1 Tax=Tullbergia mixta TaxID=1499077 RepID=A0A7T6Y707_9HEXA|nr:NADH dehydrogenase subunit 2 [Tullbergia mixta]QQK54718.1 NADH dehydrogenase subunit 2 [Tullbergia mixta]